MIFIGKGDWIPNPILFFFIFYLKCSNVCIIVKKNVNYMNI